MSPVTRSLAHCRLNKTSDPFKQPSAPEKTTVFPVSFTGWNSFLKLWLKYFFTLFFFSQFWSATTKFSGIKMLPCASYHSMKKDETPANTHKITTTVSVDVTHCWQICAVVVKCVWEDQNTFLRREQQTRAHQIYVCIRLARKSPGYHLWLKLQRWKQLFGFITG